MGEGVDIKFHSFLKLVPHGGLWSGSCPCCFTYGERTLVTNEERLGGSQGQQTLCFLGVHRIQVPGHPRLRSVWCCLTFVDPQF